MQFDYFGVTTIIPKTIYVHGYKALLLHFEIIYIVIGIIALTPTLWWHQNNEVTSETNTLYEYSFGPLYVQKTCNTLFYVAN